MAYVESYSKKELHDNAIKIEKEEDLLTKEIANILFEVEEKTEIGALNVEILEQNALKTLKGVSIFVVFTFLLLGKLIGSSIINPISKCLDGIKVIARGDYNTHIDISGENEISTLAG